MQEIRPRARWLGRLERGSVLLGGLSLTQQRQEQRRSCKTDIASRTNIDSSQQDGCVESASLDSHTSLPVRRRDSADTSQQSRMDDAEHVQPWGQDPVFDPRSSLFDSSLVGQEYVYYDVRSELNRLGAPYMWLDDLPLVIDNDVGADRANALWRAVDEGRFLDGATTGLTASVLAFNVEYEVFGYVETRYSWNADGLIHVESATSVGVPSLVPVVALSLQALAVLCFVAYASRLGSSHELASRAREAFRKFDHVVVRQIFLNQTPAHRKRKETGRGHRAASPPGVIKAHEVWDVLLAVLLVVALGANLASVLASQHIRAEASYKLHDAPQSSRAR